ncbi:MAG: nucleoside triphosphate pyrophosphohydrolase [Spirochaetes bacterium]|nr:nucleoside triphosphate pyrophosphohydrolase [Spirochaetota bacterium]
MKFKEQRPLYRLMELASILRDKCPWDKEQTSKSLKPYLIEEAYEAYDAIESDDTEHMKEELGDLLYQVYAHSEITGEQKRFTIDDVAEGIIKKLIRRHPHVFGDEEVNDKHEVIKNWEIIKKKEKSHRESILDGVPKHLPALLKAYRIQQKVSRVGFDWDNGEDILRKLDEEITEFKEVMKNTDREKIKEEAGDILFTIVNILRFIEINPEEALSSAVQKFIHRFKYIERESAKENKNLNDMSLSDIDDLWEKAKESLS